MRSLGFIIDLIFFNLCVEKCDVKPFKVKDELIELSDEDDIRTGSLIIYLIIFQFGKVFDLLKFTFFLLDNAINRTDADSSLNIDSNNQTNSDVRSSDYTLPKQQQPLNNSQCSTDDGSINSKGTRFLNLNFTKKLIIIFFFELSRANKWYYKFNHSE